ncbi:hypothetical protein AVEN_74494-1 [Araneus ventricosus]|uniref:Uncharacterized protein n=1 Tax=Araneus ventricosus TaxID=182803 RepID=A0A4Y2X6M2_ARAVE|nr:hypothetical protein AVEN_74494-1 [Araneus ventricosus]
MTSHECVISQYKKSVHIKPSFFALSLTRFSAAPQTEMATVDRKLRCLYPYIRPADKVTCHRMFECSMNMMICKQMSNWNAAHHYECLMKWDRKRIPCPNAMKGIKPIFYLPV